MDGYLRALDEPWQGDFPTAPARATHDSSRDSRGSTMIETQLAIFLVESGHLAGVLAMTE
jgi:hypothetical protein